LPLQRASAEPDLDSVGLFASELGAPSGRCGMEGAELQPTVIGRTCYGLWFLESRILLAKLRAEWMHLSDSMRSDGLSSQGSWMSVRFVAPERGVIPHAGAIRADSLHALDFV